MGVQTGFVDVEGARLYYESAGNGRVLVLIHAGIADHRMEKPEEFNQVLLDFLNEVPAG